MTAFTDVHGVRFAHDIIGNGPDITLIHAGVTDRHMWDEVVPILSRSHRVLRYDMRGFGETTEVDPGPWSGHSDLIGLLDAVGIESSTLIGVSMGGGCAINAALEHPDRVTALIAVNPGLGGHEDAPDPWADPIWERIVAAFKAKQFEETARLEIEMWLAGPHRSLKDMDPRLVERMRHWLLTSYQKEPTTENVSLDPPAAGRLGEVNAPTLAVLGELDIESMASVVDRIAAGVPRAEKVTMSGVAHLAPLEAPEEFARIVLEFLA